MTFYNNVIAGAAGAGGADAGYTIERSLRFNPGDSSHLNKSFSSAGSRTTFTLSYWIKECGKGTSPSNNPHILWSGADVNTRGGIVHRGTGSDANKIYLFNQVNNTTNCSVWSNSLHRDFSAWKHIVWVVDTTQATATNRVKLYVNGVQETLNFVTTPAQNLELQINVNQEHRIGRGFPDDYGNYMLAEMHFLDGIAISTPVDVFGEFDENTGVWNPIEYTGNYNSAGVGQVYSGMLYSSSGFGPTNTATEAFDGNLSTKASTEHNNDNYLEFTPTTPIAFTNGVQVHCYAPNGYSITNYKSVDLTGNGLGSETTFVGGGANFNGPAWINVATGSGTLYKLRIRLTRSGSNAGAAIHAIAINGSGSSSNYLVDGTPGGSNGFHLDFSDNSSNAALGTDSSGNNNTWTVNNLTEFQASTGSHGVTRGSSTLNYDPSPILDGNINTSYVDRPINGNGVNFTGIPAANTQLRVRFSYIQSGTMTTNGGHEIASGNQNGAWVEPSGISYPFTLTSISVTGGNSGDGFGISAIEVDGTILTRGSGANTDSLLDSPTNYVASSGNNGGNYATFNPLSKHGGITLSNGNLELLGAGNGWKHTQTTIAMKTGKWYCEFGPYLWKDNNNHCQPGVSRMGIANTTEMGGADFTCFYHYTGSKYFNGQAASFGSAWNNNTTNIIGIAFDADTRKVWFSLNGVWQGSGNPSAGTNHAGIINLHADGYSFGLGMHGATDSPVPMNVGARPFAYPIPTGFKSLCTQNFDNPPIAVPSTAFDVKVWTGNSGTKTISGLGFSPDLLWYKSRSVGHHHGLQDSVRGVGKSLSTSRNDIAEQTETTGLAAFTSDGFNLNGGGFYLINNNNDSYVGWAWDGGTVGTNEVGDYWSPPQYQTKYIGFKFPTSSGGRAVFGLTSGTGTADIFTSSDNNSWTRVQSDVTLSTTDTTYDSTSQYLIVVNTSNAVWGATHYAMATNGTDAHYSTSTYPGSGSSFTWSGPGYTDWDFRSSGTVLKPGSKLDSTYNQSQKWTDFWSSTNGFEQNSQTYAFNTNLSDVSASASYGDTQSLVLTTGISYTSSIRAKTHYTSGTAYINGDSGNSVNVASGWITLASGSGTLNRVDFTSSGARAYVSAIEVDGKLLIDPTPTIASTVRTNPTAGFSIATWTASGTNNDSVAHGLSKKPDFWIMKSRTAAKDWYAYTDLIDGSIDYIKLNGSDSKNNSSSTAPTSDLVHVYGSVVNTSGEGITGYFFNSVEGYSAFGTYTGNGSSDGPFVFTGFKVAWLMIKNTSTGNETWTIHDSTRDVDNPAEHRLLPNASGAESTGTSARYKDLLSNGFKIRGTSGEQNTNGDVYFYAAFAENPFKTARAR